MQAKGQIMRNRKLPIIRTLNLGLMSHPKDGAFWQYGVIITLLGL